MASLRGDAFNRWRVDMNKNVKSRCCSASIHLSVDDNGKNVFECAGCGKPCEIGADGKVDASCFAIVLDWPKK